MTRKVSRLWAIMAALSFASCTTATERPRVEVDEPYVVVPARPTPPRWPLDPIRLNQAACDECAQRGASDSSRFFFGREPLAAVDRLTTAHLEPVEPNSDAADHDFATMFTSGYFGGIYLRGALVGPAEQSTPPARLANNVTTRLSHDLDGTVGVLRRTAEAGDVAQIRQTSRRWLVPVASILGYNLGYVQVALDNPPPGVVIEPGALTCDSALRCRSEVLPLGALDRLDHVLSSLETPTEQHWQRTAAIIDQTIDRTVPSGRGVWTRLLDGSSFSPAAYSAVVDLSIGFLEVTQLALLGLAAGSNLTDSSTAQDIDSAIDGIAATASLVAWAGSYFLGLASPLPDDALPVLRCP